MSSAIKEFIDQQLEKYKIELNTIDYKIEKKKTAYKLDCESYERIVSELNKDYDHDASILDEEREKVLSNMLTFQMETSSYECYKKSFSFSLAEKYKILINSNKIQMK